MASNKEKLEGEKQNMYVRDVELITKQNNDLKKRMLKCKKKKRHCEYSTIASFLENPWQKFKAEYKTIKDLPDLLICMADLTVQILVQHRTEDKTTGSGFIQKIRRETSAFCPCHECDGKRGKGFAILTVTTVRDVFDKDCHKETARDSKEVTWNAKATLARLFYDKKDDILVKLPSLFGYRMLDTDQLVNEESDWCAVEFVTHDMRLATRLETTLKSYTDKQETVYKAMTSMKNLDRKVVIIGHPHGGPKKMSIGSYREENREVLKHVRNHQRMCRYTYDNITCRGSSGSPIYIFGQPLCGFGYWFGHPHNHCKSFKDNKGGCSSIGVEHIE